MQRVVKLRAPDDKSPSGFLVVELTADEARTLADMVETVPGPVKISNGVRWTEHVLPAATRAKIASDLRKCAKEIECLDATE